MDRAWARRFTDPVAATEWAAQGLADPAQAGYARVVQGFLHWRAGRLDVALQCATDAETELRTAGEEGWLARALSVQAVVLNEAGHAARAMELLREELKIVEALGDTEMHASANNDIGVLISFDDPRRGLTYFERAYDLLARADCAPAIQGIAALNIGEVHMMLGDDALADTYVTRGHDLLLRASAWSFWPFYVTLRVALLRRAGRLHQARDRIREAFALLDAHRDAPTHSESMLQLRGAAARVELDCGAPFTTIEMLRDLEDWHPMRAELRIEFLDLRARAEEAVNDHAAACRTLRVLLDATNARHRYEHETHVKSMEVLHRTEAALRQSREAEQAAQALREHLHAMQVLQGQLERLSSTDELTGLANRRQFDHDRAHLGPDDAVLVIDIDHFKRINDTHGHATGDATLREVAARLCTALRRSDRAYRYGGEEFTVIARGVGGAYLRELAERIRRSVSRSPVPAVAETVTVSVGASMVGRGGGLDALTAADQALYTAKRDGRDCTRLASPSA
ncbi:hypothetical protein GCM10008939_09740 [Deinococcus aquiradiocola]|uniref:GGDEF domain-containing protein n=2 Tax=Deinococcus aquiradiocola TaxID=393059 RepID=A0A917P9I2_9DEIO|nr:hypothetical protein GCM10008939_09740 [Deinococcus aquiradiocola]